MSARRSKRSKNFINYADVGKDEESDDDFAPSKSSVNNHSKQNKKSTLTEKPRRLLERELKKLETDTDLAIQLSMQSSNFVKKNDANSKNKKHSKNFQHPVSGSEDKGDNGSLKSEFGSIGIVNDEIIEISAIEVENNKTRFRTDEDKDFVSNIKSDDSDDDEIDFGENSDYENDFEKNFTKKKTKTVPNKTTKKSQLCNKSSSKKNVKVSKENKTPISTTASSVASAMCVPRSPLSNVKLTNSFKQPNWTPPGRAGEAPQVRNINASPVNLRLGLSRNIRLKRLHPSMKMN